MRKTGVWEWITGEAWKFTKWAANEPSNTSEMKTSFRLGDHHLMVIVHGMTTNLMKIATDTFSNLVTIPIQIQRIVMATG